MQHTDITDISNDRDDEILITPTSKRRANKRQLNDDFSEENTVVSQELDHTSNDSISDTLQQEIELETYTPPKPKKNKIVKTQEDAIPLSDPFPLPKHFKAEIESDLKSCCMSLKTRRMFVSDVAGSMLAYKKYPLREDYANVARSIIKEYPFLRAPPGASTPHVSYLYLHAACM